uniref:Serine and arginine rich splicing factor 4 n=1 Tax=Seriola lalandi dorsalis TaxID=1841481 RepID=A0A3B4X8R5_SERLL
MSRVYIGRLSYRAREKDVERFFKGYGKILEVDLKNGYGFVEFDDPRDFLSGPHFSCSFLVTLKGGYGRWGRDRYGPPIRTDYRLIVENLSSRCSWQDLKDYMRQAGEVTYADTHKGRRNEGVIEFRLYSDMKRALEKLDGTEVNGRKIRLIEDRPGARRSRRSYSRSRSRSRKSGSKGREQPKSDDEGGEPERGSRSRSRSPAESKSRARSKSKSKSKSRSPSPAKARSHSRSASRSESRSKSRSQSRSRSRSRS